MIGDLVEMDVKPKLGDDGKMDIISFGFIIGGELVICIVHRCS